MSLIFCLTLALFLLGVILAYTCRTQNHRSAIHGRFSGIVCLGSSLILAILTVLRPDPYALKLTPMEDVVRLAGAWKLGDDLATRLPHDKKEILIFCAEQDRQPGNQGLSLLAAFQNGAGGPKAYRWLILDTCKLNAKQPTGRDADSLIDAAVVSGVAVNAIFQQHPQAVALVFLHGLPPSEEMHDIEALSPLYSDVGDAAAKEKAIVPDIPDFPLIFALEQPENCRPLLEHELIASVVYINLQASTLDLQAKPILSLKSAAEKFWVSTSKKKSQ